MTCRCVRFQWLVFFFQAEDGIRDGHVTGVQTCALPIFASRRSRCIWAQPEETMSGMCRYPSRSPDSSETRSRRERSEERRVGKECGQLRAPTRYQKTERSKNKLPDRDEEVNADLLDTAR